MSDTHLPATTDPTAAPAAEGLEDFDINDQVTPRLTIVHGEAVYQDNLSGAKYSTMRVVLLGLVKQRILWPDLGEDNSNPLCKSFDHQNGHPDVAQHPEDFPWAKSGFDQSAWVAGEALPCAGCGLKEWQDRKPPPCTEQYALPLLYEVREEVWAPALLTVQRSAIKNTKAYLSSFARANEPLFTVVTELGLTAMKKGSNPYAVPTFARGDATDENAWRYYASQYRNTRDFITRPPRALTEDAATDDDNSRPATAAVDDDDLPF